MLLRLKSLETMSLGAKQTRNGIGSLIAPSTGFLPPHREAIGGGRCPPAGLPARRREPERQAQAGGQMGAKKGRTATCAPQYLAKSNEAYSSSFFVFFFSAAPRMSPRAAPESDEPNCATASFSSATSRALIEAETLRLALSTWVTITSTLSPLPKRSGRWSF